MTRPLLYQLFEFPGFSVRDLLKHKIASEYFPLLKKFIQEQKNKQTFSCVIYPNPVSDDGLLHIDIPEKYLESEYFDSVNIDIFDNIGKKIKSVKYSNVIDISDLSKGIYIIHINCSVTGESFVGKVISLR